MPELAPGVLTEMFGDLAAKVLAAIPVALEPVAVEVADEAKKNASNGQHKRGTPTPARPGEGPAVISGTLVESITHSAPSPSLLGGWEIRIGPQGDMYPPYYHRTPSSKYGLYLETGLRNGSTYPFLGPAFHKVGEIRAREIFAEVFGTALASL